MFVRGLIHVRKNINNIGKTQLKTIVYKLWRSDYKSHNTI